MRDVYSAVTQEFEQEIRILIVEDEETTSILLEKIFASLGCSVTAVSNGFDAIDFMKKSQVELIVMDWGLPFMSGKKTLDQIEAYLLQGYLGENIEKIPFVLCTGMDLKRIKIRQSETLKMVDIWEKSSGWLNIKLQVSNLLDELRRGVA